MVVSNRNFLFHGSIFRGELLVLGRVIHSHDFAPVTKDFQNQNSPSFGKPFTRLLLPILGVSSIPIYPTTSLLTATCLSRVAEQIQPHLGGIVEINLGFDSPYPKPHLGVGTVFRMMKKSYNPHSQIESHYHHTTIPIIIIIIIIIYLLP